MKSPFALLPKSRLALLLIVLIGTKGSNANCHCALSNSRYVTAAIVSTSATTVGQSTTPMETATSADKAPTTAPMPMGSGFIRMNTSSQLTAAFTELAFNQSTSGYQFESSNNRFSLPANDTVQPMIVMDLLVGPSGVPCRSMPQLEQICVSSACTNCNLGQYSTAAASTLIGESAFSQRIVYEATIDRSADCVGRDAFERFGDFRYLVVLPKGSPPDAGRPYAFTVSLSGNFSTYSCPATRKRRSSILAVGLQNSHQSVLRFRRATLPDCVCPPGHDPVFFNSRVALISWNYPLKLFSDDIVDKNSAGYMALARESYYLVIDSVRVRTSNLTSVIADFFDIAFSNAEIGIHLTGKLSVRDETKITNEFLMKQLASILPGVGRSIVGLKISSESAETANPSSLPAYAIVLICLICLFGFVTALISVLWRLHLIGSSPSRKLTYKANDGVEQVTSLGNTTQAADVGKLSIGATLDGAVQMPVTAFQNFSAIAPSAELASASTNDATKTE